MNELLNLAVEARDGLSRWNQLSLTKAPVAFSWRRTAEFFSR